MEFDIEKFTPVKDWLLLELQPDEERRSMGGLWLPPHERGKKTQSVLAQVLRVGERQKDVEPGDFIVIKRHQGTIVGPNMVVCDTVNNDVLLCIKPEPEEVLDFQTVSDRLLGEIHRLEGQANTCSACGQEDKGQTGEYPCAECGLPQVWDSEV